VRDVHCSGLVLQSSAPAHTCQDRVDLGPNSIWSGFLTVTYVLVRVSETVIQATDRVRDLASFLTVRCHASRQVHANFVSFIFGDFARLARYFTKTAEIVCSFILTRIVYCIGLPTVPYFPGRPVFQPLCPASRLESSRDARCPVFWPLHSFVSNTSVHIEFQYKVSRYDRSSWSPVAFTTNFEEP